MKASELLAELTKIIKESGDFEVVVGIPSYDTWDECYDYGMYDQMVSLESVSVKEDDKTVVLFPNDE